MTDPWIKAFFFLFAGAMVVFWIKLLFVDTMRAKNVLKRLVPFGFEFVDPAREEEVQTHLLAYLRWKHTRRTDVTIKQVVVQRKAASRFRFVGSVHTVTSSRGKNFLNQYTTLVEIAPTHVIGDIEIRTRLPEMYEGLLDTAIPDAEKTGRQVIESGLNRAFLDKFTVIARPEDALTLPDDVQHTLLWSRMEFPLREPGYVTYVYVTPSGWSVTCQRILQPRKLAAMLPFADKLTASFSGEGDAVS